LTKVTWDARLKILIFWYKFLLKKVKGKVIPVLN
jgi:hypothetical protein